MVQLNETYQANPNMKDEYQAKPPGKYRVMFVDSKMNNKGTGITCEFSVLDGEYQNAKFWLNLSIFSENEKARQIGYKYINQLALAAGKAAISDTSELHGKAFVVTVKIRKDDPSQNDITSIEADSVQAVPAAAAKKPWQK